jgi:hypothetical protein
MEKWYILQPIVIFKAKWYILWSFGTFYPVLVCCSETNPATLVYYIYLKGLGQVARLHKAVHLVTPKYTF